jgi:hypothetical protein
MLEAQVSPLLVPGELEGRRRLLFDIVRRLNRESWLGRGNESAAAGQSAAQLPEGAGIGAKTAGLESIGRSFR